MTRGIAEAGLIPEFSDFISKYTYRQGGADLRANPDAGIIRGALKDLIFRSLGYALYIVLVLYYHKYGDRDTRNHIVF